MRSGAVSLVDPVDSGVTPDSIVPGIASDPSGEAAA
jgi:hypothetical protein